MTKKINKRVLRKRAESRKASNIIIISMLIFSSPIWFYWGVMHKIILPIWGEKNKAVLSGRMKHRHWSGLYAPPIYYYSFYKNGKEYSNSARILVSDSLYHMGDTVDILYLKKLPFINSVDESAKNTCQN